MSSSLVTRSSKPVAIWLLIGVGMIIIQILLGGITRLTGSGLSITEWNVVTGTLPPFNEQQWIVEFNKYKQTPQFQILNFEFTLKDFKFIFFWEWLHRFWARLIGVIFFVPFIIFLMQRRFRPSMVRPMMILFLLGALQGAIGWIMVASGLTGDAIYVKPAKLALHFIFALGLLCYTFWFAMVLLVKREERLIHPGLSRFINLILFVLVVQLVFGAFMAGHKAATAAPTWPDINGYLVPPNMIDNGEGFLNLVDNKIMIHFIHRGLAYILLVLLIILTVRLYKLKVAAILIKTRIFPLVLVVIQALLGIFSVLASITVIPNKWGLFEWLAEFHQLVAMSLLLSLIWIRFLITRNIPSAV